MHKFLIFIHAEGIYLKLSKFSFFEDYFGHNFIT